MVSIFDPWFAHSQISLVELWGVSGDKGLIRPGRCLALGSHIDTHIHTCTLLPHPSTSLDAQCLSGRRDRLKERVQSLTYPPPEPQFAPLSKPMLAFTRRAGVQVL